MYADFRAAKAANRYGSSDPVYRDPLLDVAAPLMGRPKDDLDGEDIRVHRRTERIAWAAALFMVVLGLTAGIGMKMAHDRQKIAASRALASEAMSHVDDRSLAMLLSIESGRIADTVESRRALLAAIQRVPQAEAFLWGHTDAVTKAVFSPDGQSILSAGWDDRIVLWNATSHQPIGQPIPCPKGTRRRGIQSRRLSIRLFLKRIDRALGHKDSHSPQASHSVRRKTLFTSRSHPKEICSPQAPKLMAATRRLCSCGISPLIS